MRRALALALLALAACGGSGPRRGGVAPQNALLITVGGLRADRLTAYLYPRATTYLPFSAEERLRGDDLSIDAVVAQGVAFANAYSPSGNSAAALASVLTGRHPLEACVLSAKDELDSAVPTLAERFAAADFRTAAFVSGFPIRPGVSIGRGFATCAGEEGLSDEDVLRDARDWVDGLAEGERFFLWVHLRSPTTVTDAPHEAAERYDAAVLHVNQLVFAFLSHLAGRSEPPDPPPRDRLADTALVLTAPTGIELGDRQGYVGHRKSLQDAALHVPLVLRHPRSMTGRRVMSEVVGLDRVAPTLADWFELEPLGSSESLLALVDGARSSDDGAACLSTRGGRVFSLRTGRWRLVWNPGGGVRDDDFPSPELALFDTHADPREERDCAAQEQEVARELLAALVHELELMGSGCLTAGELDELRQRASQ